MSEDVEGTVLVERYTLERLLGAGGMGRVYLADDTMLNRKVAIKQILTHATITDGSGAARAMREARVAARLDHPYAVPVYDVFTVNDEPYMVMGYVEGESLAERLDRDHSVPLAQAGKLIGQTASALSAAHEMDIVHRDIKPANILITKRGSAKLADFGIARATSDPSMTSTGMVIGSVAYMAPEVAQGDPASGASDVFSLGATFFAALEGKAPFDGDSSATILLKLVSEPAPRSPAAGPLNGLLGAMLDKEPRNRPTAEEVEEALLNRAPLERWRRFDRGAVMPGPRPGVLPPGPPRGGPNAPGGYGRPGRLWAARSARSGGQPAGQGQPGQGQPGGYGQPTYGRPSGPSAPSGPPPSGPPQFGRPGQPPNPTGRPQPPPPQGSPQGQPQGPPQGPPRNPGSPPPPPAGQRPVSGPPPRVQAPGPSGPPPPVRGTVEGTPRPPLSSPGASRSAPSAPSGQGFASRPSSGPSLPPPPPGARPVSTSGPQPQTSGPRPPVSGPRPASSSARAGRATLRVHSATSRTARLRTAGTATLVRPASADVRPATARRRQARDRPTDPPVRTPPDSARSPARDRWSRRRRVAPPTSPTTCSRACWSGPWC